MSEVNLDEVARAQDSLITIARECVKNKFDETLQDSLDKMELALKRYDQVLEKNQEAFYNMIVKNDEI